MLDRNLACAYVPDGDENSVLTVMRTLLDLWQALLACAATPEEPELQRPVYAVVLAVVRRPEFSLARLAARLRHVAAPAEPAPSAPGTRAPPSPGTALAMAAPVALPPSPGGEELLAGAAARVAVLEPDAAICARYRLLLFATLRLVTRQMGAAVRPDDLGLLPDDDVRIGSCRRVLSFPDDRDDDSSSTSSSSSSSEGGEKTKKAGEERAAAAAAAAVPEPEEVSKSVAAMLGAALPRNMDVQDVGADSVGALHGPSPPTSPEKQQQFRVGTPTKVPRATRPVQDMSLAFAEFAQRFLAVAFWRLPCVRADIVAAVQARVPALPRNVHPFAEEEPGSSSSSSSREYDADCSEYAELLGWPRWHAALKRVTRDTEEERVAVHSRRWAAHLARLGAFFVAFFREWLAGTTAALGGRPAVYARLPGFVVLARAVYALSGRLVPVREQAVALALPKAELLLLATGHPQPFAALVQLAYACTPVRETPRVVATLLALDTWLADLAARRMLLGGRAFDAAAFCRGLDVILQTDHHMILARLLTMVYAYGSLFRGRARLALFRTLLLQHHFYHLFLHWNDNVRSIFCQVLVYRALLTKRRYLGTADKHSAKARRQQQQQQGGGVTSCPASSGAAAAEAAADDCQGDSAESIVAVDLAVSTMLEAYLASVFCHYDYCAQGRGLPAVGAPAPRLLSLSLEQDDAAVGDILRAAPAEIPSRQLPHKVYHVEGASAADDRGVCPADAAPGPEKGGAWVLDPCVPGASAAVPPDAVPPHLGVYLVRACDEYRKYMVQYNEWQAKGGSSEPPKLVALE